MSVRVLAALTLAVLTTAGCAPVQDDATSELTSSGSTAVGPTLAVPTDEAKAVIQDWLDGIFNSPHHCEAVRAAIARLPTSTREYMTVYDDMRSLERRTST